MKETILFPAGNTAVLRFARLQLEDMGIRIAVDPGAGVTHLLLPVPSFEADGHIRGGGDPEQLLAELPEDVTVIGGNLDHPALKGYSVIDLLRDPRYLAENAAITADCAIRIAGSNLETVFAGCPVLVIGWGRIGKCLSSQLKSMGADVTVSARKAEDLAMLCALGFGAEHTATLGRQLARYRVIFNTVPAPVISEEQASCSRTDCIKIDLASKPGIGGSGVIWARGLPGKDTPEASGALIARTVIRLLSGREGCL